MVFMQTQTEILPLMPGQRLARGSARLLRTLGHSTLTEFVPTRGLRVDLITMGPKGEIWIIECKSSRADFVTDRKWQGYLEWCDRYFWAVDAMFPTDLLPEGGGLIVADDYGAELRQMAPETRLAAARRTRLTRDIARAASFRLQTLADPQSLSDGAF